MLLTRSGLGAFAVGALLLAASGCQKAAEPPKPPPPPTVTFDLPVSRTVTEFEEFSGRTWSPDTIEIRARVNGYLKRAEVKDGADVTKDQLLFQIEDDQYVAELERSEAALEQATATMERLQSQHQRAEKLLASRTISQEAYDNLKFQTSEAKAAMLAAKAARDLAALNVEYTKIKSPIDGRLSRRLVDPGNLVKTDDTLLANVVSLDPIFAYFDFDERTIIRMRALVDKGELAEAPDRSRPVQIALAGESDFRYRGTINWVDNQVDVGTGTLRARVEIANQRLKQKETDPSLAGETSHVAVLDEDGAAHPESPGAEAKPARSKDYLLSPGMFVRLRVPVGPPRKVLLVPESALGSDQGRRYVYVIDDENKIVQRHIEVGQLDGNERVVLEGVSSNDRIVISGLQRVRAGVTVTPMDKKTATELEEKRKAEAAARAKAAKEKKSEEKSH